MYIDEAEVSYSTVFCKVLIPLIRLKKLAMTKKQVSPEIMCYGLWNSYNLAEFYKYILDLKYEEAPDYDYWVEL